MPRLAYVNGRFIPHASAFVHIEDRGYQFADAVYEVVAVQDGAFVDLPGHLERLRYSLGELRIRPPLGLPALTLIMHDLVRRNRIRDGSLYLQITRGVAPRDFKFPTATKSAIVMTTRRRPTAPVRPPADGVAVVTVPELRWARRDIKSTSLLAQVLAKQQAAEAGAFEAWMVDPDGFVTEGASSNAWIVDRNGVLVTRQADRSILKGVTGNAIAGLAAGRGLEIERRKFSVAEALNAREAFLTSATTFCVPVTRIDLQPVGDGRPGPVATALGRHYLDYAGRQEPPFGWAP
jgi:D-alanine transaminase